MPALFWLISLLAAAQALVFPVRTSLPCLLLFLPFCNAYGAALAGAIIVGRWLTLDRHGAAPLTFAVWAPAAIFALALVPAIIEVSDLARFFSESAQWLLSISLYVIVCVDRSPELTRSVARGFACGAVLLALAQLTARALDVELTDDVSTVLLRSDASNYASFYYLIALVLVPLSLSEAGAGRVRLVLFLLGLTMIFYNESRAQFAAAAAIGIYAALRASRRPWMWLSVGIAAVAVPATILLARFRDDVFNPDSPFSLLNFANNYSNLERLGLILYAINLFLVNPFGYGIGTSSVLFPAASFTLGSYPSPHNTFAMLIVEFGVLGLAAYAALALFLSVLALRGLVGQVKGGEIALGLLMATVFDAVFFNGIISILFFVTMALTIRANISSAVGIAVILEPKGPAACVESPA